MKLLKQSLRFFSILTILTMSSCVKEALPEPACSCEQQANTEAKQLLMATTWQIEEVIDPFGGVRYKRGVITDSKNFSVARYQYHENNALTGTDWFGQPWKASCYTFLDNDKKLKITNPVCATIETIITLSATQFVYKAADGTIFTLQPIKSSGSSSREL